MRHLDLFSGIGGFALAAQTIWGKEYECIGFCEIDRYCQELLKLRFPGDNIYGDIRNLSRERLITDTDSYGQCGKDEINTAKNGEQTFSKSERRYGNDGSIDLLTGGFPCQPFSQAGKRKGKEDDRYLWPEMLRVIKEFKPTWIVGENVAGILNMAQQECDADLEDETDNDENGNGSSDSDGVLWEIIESLEQVGYSVQTFVIPACAIGAPHRRDRIWIVAHSVSDECRGRSKSLRKKEKISGVNRPKICSRGASGTSKDVADTRNKGLQRGQRIGTFPKGKKIPHGATSKCGRNTAWDQNWLEVATELCGVDDGLSAGVDGFELSKSKHRVERLKALGNAIVPQVVMEIFKGIKEIEENHG